MGKSGNGIDGAHAGAEKHCSSDLEITPSPDHPISRSPQAILDELIPSDTLNIEGVLARVVALLEENSWNEDVGNVQLALQEALMNAILHGSHSDPGKRVRVSVAIEEGATVIIVVKDSGAGFDPNKIPDPTLGDNIYRDRGRGVFLIRQLMDEVEYQFGDGTALTMRRHAPNRRPR
jgi:serine/threonine-protein kinase RsbW